VNVCFLGARIGGESLRFLAPSTCGTAEDERLEVGIDGPSSLATDIFKGAIVLTCRPWERRPFLHFRRLLDLAALSCSPVKQKSNIKANNRI